MKSGLLVLFGLLCVSSCGPSEQGSTPAPVSRELPSPTGAVWRWTGVRGGDPAEVTHANRYTIEFMDDGRYSVRADCNSGAGSWSIEGEGLRLNAGPMTLAACEQGSLDSRYLKLLGAVTGLSRSGDELVLLIGGGATTMQFSAMKEVSLAGSSWLVRAWNNGRQAVVSVVGDTELHMSFGEDGRVTGSAGCNNFHAEYELQAQTLNIGLAASTRRTCMTDGIMEQETGFLTAISTVGSWEIRGERLQLRSREGSLAVDLVSAVTGTVSYRTRQALPEEARLTVQLQDISLADAAAVLIGEQTMLTGGKQVPIAFEVSFDPTEIEPNHTYGLRATISTADGLAMTTTEVYPVLTLDHGQFGIELIVEPAGH
jgi:uncharacterized lipoprotein YbaY/heat shock protein HslJ